MDEIATANGAGAASFGVTRAKRRRPSPAMEKVRAVLSDGEADALEICDKTGLEYGSVYGALSNLSERGEAERRGGVPYKYFLVNAESARAAEASGQPAAKAAPGLTENEAAIYGALARLREADTKRLCEDTGLSHPTVKKALDGPLKDAGLATSWGRKPAVYRAVSAAAPGSDAPSKEEADIRSVLGRGPRNVAGIAHVLDAHPANVNMQLLELAGRGVVVLERAGRTDFANVYRMAVEGEAAPRPDAAAAAREPALPDMKHAGYELSEAEAAAIAAYGLDEPAAAAYSALLDHGEKGYRIDVLARKLGIRSDAARARLERPAKLGLVKRGRVWTATDPREFFAKEAGRNRALLKGTKAELDEALDKLRKANLELFGKKEENLKLTRSAESDGRTIENLKRDAGGRKADDSKAVAMGGLAEELYKSVFSGVSRTAVAVYNHLDGAGSAMSRKQLHEAMPDVHDFKVNLAVDGELLKKGFVRKEGEAYVAVPLREIVDGMTAAQVRKAESERDVAALERDAANSQLGALRKKAGEFSRAELEYMSAAGIDSIGMEAYRTLVEYGPASNRELSKRMHIDPEKIALQVMALKKCGMAAADSGRLKAVRVDELLSAELGRAREALNARDADAAQAVIRPPEVPASPAAAVVAAAPGEPPAAPDKDDVIATDADGDGGEPQDGFSAAEVGYLSHMGVYRDTRAVYRSLLRRGSIDTSGMREGRPQLMHLLKLKEAGLAEARGAVYSPRRLTDLLFKDIEEKDELRARGRKLVEGMAAALTAADSEDTKVLNSVGLFKEELGTYKAMLGELGPSTPDSIAARAGIDAHKAQAYMDSLVKKGMADLKDGLYTPKPYTKVLIGMVRDMKHASDEAVGLVSDMRKEMDKAREGPAAGGAGGAVPEGAGDGNDDEEDADGAPDEAVAAAALPVQKPQLPSSAYMRKKAAAEAREGEGDREPPDSLDWEDPESKLNDVYVKALDVSARSMMLKVKADEMLELTRYAVSALGGRGAAEAALKSAGLLKDCLDELSGAYDRDAYIGDSVKAYRTELEEMVRSLGQEVDWTRYKHATAL